MADKKISELDAAGVLAGTEQIAVVQSASTVRTTAQDIADLAGSTPGGSDTQLQYNNGGSFGGAAQVVYDDATGNLSLLYADSEEALVFTAAATGPGLDDPVIIEPHQEGLYLSRESGGVNRVTLFVDEEANFVIAAANASVADTTGADFELECGSGLGTGDGGSFGASGGSGGASSGTGGTFEFAAGNGGAPNGNGGGFQLQSGDGVGTGIGGDIRLTIGLGGTNGNLTILNLPTSNPGGTNRVWRDSGVLKIT